MSQLYECRSPAPGPRCPLLGGRGEYLGDVPCASCERDGYTREHEHAEQHELRAEGDLTRRRWPVGLLLHVVAVVVALVRARRRLRLLLRLAPGPPTSSDVIAAGTVDGRHDASWATPSAPPAPSAPPELPAPSAPSAFPEPSAPPLPSPPPASALPPAPLGASVAPAHGTERGGGRTSAACTTPGRTTRAVIGVSGSASRLSSPPPPPSESPCEPTAPAPAPAPPLVVKGPLVPFTPTPGWPVPSADCGKGCCGEGW